MNSVNLFIKKLTFQFGKANKSELKHIKNLGLSKDDEEFYANNFPKTEVNLNVILLPLSEIINEQYNLIPGCYVSGFRFIPIATSYSGNLFCMDLSKLEITQNVRIVMFYPDSKEQYSSIEKVYGQAVDKCFGIKRFYEMCFGDDEME